MVFEQNQGDNYNNIGVFFYRSFVSHKMRLSFNNSNRNGFFFRSKKLPPSRGMYKGIVSLLLLAKVGSIWLLSIFVRLWRKILLNSFLKNLR